MQARSKGKAVYMRGVRTNAQNVYLRVHVYILPVSFRHVAALQQELAAAIARADTAEQECERLAVVSVSLSAQVSALSLLY